MLAINSVVGFADMNQGGQLQVAMLQQQYVCLILSCLVSIYLSKKILGCMTMIDCLDLYLVKVRCPYDSALAGLVFPH
jgi:hypothetical protein